MASLKREYIFRNNHERYASMKRGFKFSFWASVLPSAATFLVLTVIYFVKALALMAGSSMIIAEKLVGDIIGTSVSDSLGYKVPYLYMFALLSIAVISFFTMHMQLKKPNYLLFVIYALFSAYGLIGMFAGWCGVGFGLYAIVYGAFGMWLEDFVLRLHKEKEYLSTQDGYPDFIVVIDEPRAMANSLGLSYDESEFKKRQRKENPKLEDKSSEMDELTVDMELPKGKRKIDNMM